MLLNLANFIIVEHTITHKDDEVKEVYGLNTTDFSVARPIAQFVAEARACILPLNTSLRRVKMSTIQAKFDSVYVLQNALVGTLLAAEVALESCNDTEVGYLYRFQDGEGHHCQRLIRIIRDSWLADREKTQAASGSTLGTVTPSGGGLVPIAPAMAAADALGNWLGAFRDNCYSFRPSEAGPFPYDLISYNDYAFSKVGFKKTGRSTLKSPGRRKATV